MVPYKAKLFFEIRFVLLNTSIYVGLEILPLYIGRLERKINKNKNWVKRGPPRLLHLITP